MQPVTRSEQDKMVPIDTSGASVEIELEDQKKEAKDEEQNTVVEEQPKEEPIQEEPIKQEPAELVEGQDSEEEDDTSREKEESEKGPTDKGLRRYSKRQKQRMQKMLARLKDMEEYADSITKERDKLKDQLSSVGKGYVSEFEGRVTSAVEAAKSKLKKAIEDNDTEAQVTAQEQLAQAKADSVRLANLRANQKREEDIYKANQGQQTQQQQYQPRDYKAEAWAANNTWFNDSKHADMTSAAMSYHDQLLQEGFDPTSDEYYNEIDSYIKEEFPDYFQPTENIVEKTPAKQPTQTVASAVRKNKSGRRTVKLTPSQVAIAKKLGVPLEEYAKYVKEGA
jgi:hypothetical protein